MKLKHISCTQFAGVLNKDVALNDGINVIYGKNESGKSTLVNLISRVLFQNSKVDGRKDKDFREKYFPSAIKDNDFVGDFADGSLVFEIDGEEYKLTKDWGTRYGATLSTPYGVIRDEEKINDILKEKLGFGEGVYNDMLLSSQYNTDLSLQSLLDATQKTDAKQEITDAVSRAFVQSDGVSVDAIEEAILQKISEIKGEHWDCERNMPERRNARWVKGLGEILKAYYRLEDAEQRVEKIDLLQCEADRATDEYNAQNDSIKALEDIVVKLDSFSNLIVLQKEYKKTVARCSSDLEKCKKVLLAWPNYIEKIEKAKKLKTELEGRKTLDLFDKAKNILDSIASINGDIANALCPSEDEIKQVKKANANILNLQNKLCGMNINASIKMLSDKGVSITSLVSGKDIEFSENMTLSEAVRVSIPGVMDMELSPADIDINEVEANIIEQKAIIDATFKKYNVKDIDSLEKLAKGINDAKGMLNIYNQKLSVLLGDTKLEDLEKSASQIGNDVRDENSINDDIVLLCEGMSVDRFIASSEAFVNSYVNDYESIDKLKIKMFDINSELENANQKLKEDANIPKELEDIDDPEQYISLQKSKLKLARENREQALKTKTEASSKLEIYINDLDSDPKDAVDMARREFNEQKELLENWQAIYDKFLIQKQAINNNPMDDIADSFCKYLQIISNGRVESVFPEADKLKMNVYSNNHIMDYDKLSQGTKETVSLAFRLAVIDHLFPNGNGVVVFDDPFTDMDSERTKQSSELIKECAKHNQVIVLTCKEENKTLLGGNLIEM